MASVNVLNKTVHGKSERIKLSSVNLKGKVSKLKDDVSKKINLPVTDIELIYCGQRLEDGKDLEASGLKSGATLFVLKKQTAETDRTPEKMTDMDIRQLVATLQSALLNPAYRSTVEKMLNSSEALENIIAATPGLEKDPVAISMLQDQELLAILAHPGNIKQVIEKHPAFGQAAIMIATAVSEEGAKQDEERLHTGSYSMDQMSDDEDDAQSNRPGPSSGGGSVITASQLAAALAAASGGMSPQTSQRESNIANMQSPGVITTDFFQQAIRQAQDTSNQGQLQTQLRQLQDMGITDDALALRALQATGGDLQAALDILFGDGHI